MPTTGLATDTRVSHAGRRRTFEAAAKDSGTLRVLGMLAFAQLAISLPTETLPLATSLLTASPGARPGVLLLVASQVLALLALLLRRARMWQAWALFGMLLLGIDLCIHHRGSFELHELLIPGYWLFPLVVLALKTLDRRRYLAFAVTATTLLVGQFALHAPPTDWVAASQLLWIVQPIIQVLVFGDVMVLAGVNRDRTLRRQEEARLQREKTQLEGRTRREASRLLHDHVLHALHALARATPGRLEELAVEECREAHRVMTRHAQLPDEVSVEDLLRADPALTSAGARLTGSERRLPRAIATTIAAAVHEALQNVVRHAQANHTGVHVDAGERGVVVEVTDDGRGFDSARTALGRLGVQASILQRMDDIGGQAETFSSPGHGTTVVLSWPRTHQETEVLWSAAPATSLRRNLTRTVWPGLVTGLLMTLLAGPHLARPLPAMAGALLVLAVGAAATLAVHRNPLRRGWQVALLAVAVAGWLWNLWLVPTAPEHDYLLWMAWGASALVQLVVVSERPAVGLAVVLGWAGVQVAGILWRYHDPVWVWRLSSLISAGAGEGAITLLVLLVARRAAAHQAHAARLATSTRTATAQLQMQEHLQRYWSRRVTEEALPLLSGVSDGTHSPLDPLVRLKAETLETALRDELLLGPDNVAVLQALATSRASGWQITSTLTREDPPEAIEEARQLLLTLGRPHRSGQPVTLSTGPRGAVAVVLDASRDQARTWREHLADLGGGADVDPEFVRLGLPLTARPQGAGR